MGEEVSFLTEGVLNTISISQSIREGTRKESRAGEIQIRCHPSCLSDYCETETVNQP